MERKKGVFLSIIFFLIILIPLTSLSIYYKFFKEPIEENENHLFHFNNKLYFYENDKLLGTYPCQDNSCDYATFSIDDDIYDINYYNEKPLIKSTVINGKYVFIKDQKDEENIIVLYDLVDSKVLSKLTLVKNYGIGIENNLFIVKNADNKAGVISLDNTYKVLIPFDYEFIGLNSNINDNILYADNFIIKNDDGWGVLSPTGGLLSKYFDDAIYLTNGKYIEIKDGEYFDLYDYEHKQIEKNKNFIKINYYQKYIEFLTSNNVLYYYDYDNSQKLSDEIKLNNPIWEGTLYPPYETKIEDNKLVITVYKDQTYGTTNIYSYDILN